MGICYNLILEDEWDWDYSDTSKEERLKEFETKWKETGYIERIGQWYRVAVYDIDKSFPYSKERLDLIREYADNAYYQDDTGIGIKELDLPYQKPSELAYVRDIASRRTDEEKKASEDIVREKIKNESYDLV